MKRITVDDGGPIDARVDELSTLVSQFEAWLAEGALYFQRLGQKEPSDCLAAPSCFEPPPEISGPPKGP